MPWNNWLWLFKYFLTGSGIDGAAEFLNLVVLFGSLGEEACRVASDLTDATTDIATTIQLLTDRFGERQSLVLRRSKFHCRSQRTGEDVLSIVMELCWLGFYCCYYDAVKDTVRDWLVAGFSDEKIRERLFEVSDIFRPDYAVVLAQTVERATSESKRLSYQRGS